MISPDDVLACFDYDRDRGFLLRKKATCRNPAGSVVGYPNEKGYLRCRVKGKTLKVHRVIWLLENGKFPDMQLDHINGNKQDNRIVNLREVTTQENHQNKKTCQGYYETSRGKFRADIYIDGKKISVGTFDTPEEASAAYWIAKKKYYSGYVHTE